MFSAKLVDWSFGENENRSIAFGCCCVFVRSCESLDFGILGFSGVATSGLAADGIFHVLPLFRLVFPPKLVFYYLLFLLLVINLCSTWAKLVNNPNESWRILEEIAKRKKKKKEVKSVKDVECCYPNLGRSISTRPSEHIFKHHEIVTSW